MPPSARERSATSRRRLRGTSGSGLAIWRSYSSYLRSRPISSVSRKPAVVMRPVRAPLRSISALVKSVVAWTTRVKCSGSEPSLAEERADACRHGAGRVLVGGEDLAAPLAPAVVVVDHDVGEGAADVDPERMVRHGETLGPRTPKGQVRRTRK